MTKGLENGWQVGEASRDFDVRRAFAHGEYMGALREQERIIKLLIDKAIEWRTADLHQQANYIDFAIALIKGENK